MSPSLASHLPSGDLDAHPPDAPSSPLSSLLTSPPPSFFDNLDLPLSPLEPPNNSSDDDLFEGTALPDEELLATIAELEDNNDDDDDDDDSATPNVQSNKRHALSRARTRRKHCTEKKLDVMVNALRRTRWTFEDFLEAWVGDTEDKDLDLRVAHKSYHTRKARRRVMDGILKSFRGRGLVSNGDIAMACCKELNLLQKDPSFGIFTEKVDVESIDFAAAIDAVRRIAPTWHTFASRVMGNTRLNYASYGAKGVHGGLNRRVFAVTSMVSHSRAKQRSNFLASSLDLYLLGTSTHRKVIEVLAGFGLCHTYHSANKLMHKLSDEATKHLITLSSNLQTTDVWDNLNAKTAVRHEDSGHKQDRLDITNASICINDNMPASGLLQSMHNPTIPLRLDDIVFSEGLAGSQLDVDISYCLISDAVRRVHPTAVDDIFSGSAKTTYPEFPSIDCLPSQKTKFWQYAAVFENEGTIEGTYKVIDDLYLRQRGLHAPDDPASAGPDDFRERLFLAHGDQLTAHHIRSVKAEQMRAVRPYDKRDWLLGLPAWFHIQMNLLFTIVRTHFDPSPAPPCPGDHHTIAHDVTMWGRSQTTRDSVKYHLLEPIVAQGFTSRVVGLFYAAMRRRGLFQLLSQHSVSTERMEDVTELVRSLTPNQFLEIVNDVYQTAFTQSAWDSNVQDVEFRTMCRYLQEVELFLTVRHAVAFGDIGLLQRLVDPLIIVFFGAKQHNYGREMLFYRWNLTNVNTLELQRSILATGLVNWKGLPSTFKPIDLHMEHLNLAAKVDIKTNRNSTHDAEETFKRRCLCSTWLRSLRAQLEGYFGEDMSDKHTSRIAVPDMYLLARTLLNDELLEPRDANRLRNYAMYDSPDIRQEGLALLEEKVIQFNQQHVRTPGKTSFYPLVDQDNPTATGFDDISEYANVITDELYGMLDPTVSIETLDLT